jgi:hypothetical protein
MQLLALVVATVLPGAFGAKTCHNPVFEKLSHFGDGSWTRLSTVLSAMPDEPLTVPDRRTTKAGVGMCTYFAGREGCCSNKTLDAAEEAYVQASAAIARASVLPTASNFTDYVIDAVEAAGAALCVASKAREQCEARVQAAVSGGRGALASALHAIQRDLLTCMAGLESYAMGMVCFACSTDAAEFVENASLPSAVIKLADSSCTAVYDACSPLLSDDEYLLQAADSLAQAVADAVGHPLPPLPDGPPHALNLCGTEAASFSSAECKEYVCTGLLNGFSIPNLDAHFQSHFDAARVPSLRALRQAALRGTDTWAEPPLSAPTPRFNVNQAQGGYDAVGVGCADVCAEEGSHPSWGTLAGCTVGAGVVGALATGMAMRARRKRGAAPLLSAAEVAGGDEDSSYAQLHPGERRSA